MNAEEKQEPKGCMAGPTSAIIAVGAVAVLVAISAVIYGAKNLISYIFSHV